MTTAIIRTRTMPSGEYAAVVVEVSDGDAWEWVGVYFWPDFGDYVKDVATSWQGCWTHATVSIATDTLAEALAELGGDGS